LLLVLAFGVRPPSVWPLRGRASGGGRAGTQAASGRSGGRGATVLRPVEPVEIDPERLRTQEIFEQVTGHLKREPTQSSRLLQSWIHSE